MSHSPSVLGLPKVFFSIASAIFSILAFADIGTVFVAVPPYSPQIGDATRYVELDGKPRTFDFGGDTSFVNPATSVSDIGSINVWNPQMGRADALNSSSIPQAGVKDRVFKTSGYTAIGYIRGDGIVEGKLRTQINSFPIPARRRFLWDLRFRVGGGTLNSPWAFTPRGFAPATIWQLKTIGLPPALVMAIDTDPVNGNKLALNFDARLDPLGSAVRIGDVGGLSPGSEIEVSVDAFLDERTIVLGGQGFLRIKVNGVLIVDRWGPVLQSVADAPYHWSIGMYLYANVTPLAIDRFVYWRRARMLSPQ